MTDAMLENRATVCAGNKEVHCSRCDEPFVFGMKDNFHEFSIGLTTEVAPLFGQETAVP